jgi:hypothetical protein
MLQQRTGPDAAKEGDGCRQVVRATRLCICPSMTDFATKLDSQGHLNVVLRGSTPKFFNVRTPKQHFFTVSCALCCPVVSGSVSWLLQVRDGPYFPTIRLLHMCTCSTQLSLVWLSSISAALSVV